VNVLLVFEHVSAVAVAPFPIVTEQDMEVSVPLCRTLSVIVLLPEKPEIVT
jgi:hypothetical protein